MYTSPERNHGMPTPDICINCDGPNPESYDLTVRGRTHTNVSLCPDCHAAIQTGLQSTN
jgi:hypothetical protein